MITSIAASSVSRSKMLHSASSSPCIPARDCWAFSMLLTSPRSLYLPVAARLQAAETSRAWGGRRRGCHERGGKPRSLKTSARSHSISSRSARAGREETPDWSQATKPVIARSGARILVSKARRPELSDSSAARGQQVGTDTVAPLASCPREVHASRVTRSQGRIRWAL